MQGQRKARGRWGEWMGPGQAFRPRRLSYRPSLRPHLLLPFQAPSLLIQARPKPLCPPPLKNTWSHAPGLTGMSPESSDGHAPGLTGMPLKALTLACPHQLLQHLDRSLVPSVRARQQVDQDGATVTACRATATTDSSSLLLQAPASRGTPAHDRSREGETRHSQSEHLESQSRQGPWPSLAPSGSGRQRTQPRTLSQASCRAQTALQRPRLLT